MKSLFEILIGGVALIATCGLLWLLIAYALFCGTLVGENISRDVRRVNKQ